MVDQQNEVFVESGDLLESLVDIWCDPPDLVRLSPSSGEIGVATIIKFNSKFCVPAGSHMLCLGFAHDSIMPELDEGSCIIRDVRLRSPYLLIGNEKYVYISVGEAGHCDIVFRPVAKFRDACEVA